jgi:hypothetical protein
VPNKTVELKSVGDQVKIKSVIGSSLSGLKRMRNTEETNEDMMEFLGTLKRPKTQQH